MSTGVRARFVETRTGDVARSIGEKLHAKLHRTVRAGIQNARYCAHAPYRACRRRDVDTQRLARGLRRTAGVSRLNCEAEVAKDCRCSGNGAGAGVEGDTCGKGT